MYPPCSFSVGISLPFVVSPAKRRDSIDYQSENRLSRFGVNMVNAGTKWGIATFATAETVMPDQLAPEVERLGFSSLWFSEHSHIPLSRRTPWPGGGELPWWYYRAFDPIAAIGAAAATTTALRLGTGIALLVQRDPIQFAKEIATLDVISSGRIDVGVGGGWNLEEMEDHGTDPSGRWKLLRERVEAIRAIWTMEEAEYRGDLVAFEPMASFPKPVQKPHPPIYLGGGYPRGLQRAIRYADGWMPILGRGGPEPAWFAAEMRSQAAAAGRDPASLEFLAYNAPRDERAIAELIAAGADSVIWFLEPSALKESVAALGELASLRDRVERENRS
jgi:probable F420-dependent oxidoreductase